MYRITGVQPNSKQRDLNAMSTQDLHNIRNSDCWAQRDLSSRTVNCHHHFLEWLIRIYCTVSPYWHSMKLIQQSTVLSAHTILEISIKPQDFLANDCRYKHQYRWTSIHFYAVLIATLTVFIDLYLNSIVWDIYLPEHYIVVILSMWRPANWNQCHRCYLATIRPWRLSSSLDYLQRDRHSQIIFESTTSCKVGCRLMHASM